MGRHGGEHILTRFDGDLHGLRDLALTMGETAIALVEKAIGALLDADAGAARQVIYQQKRINELDMEGQEEGVRILATHSPVARDLRLVVCLMRCFNELERTANQARRISRIVQREQEEDGHSPSGKAIFSDVAVLAEEGVGMMRLALEAMRVRDVEAAVAVLQADARLDQLFEGAMRRLATFLFEDARNIRSVMDAVFALKAMERVGDHAANIAAQLIYAVKGVDVRYVKADNLSAEYLGR